MAASSNPARDDAWRSEIDIDHDISEEDDFDSALGSDTSSHRTTSVTSTIYNYRYENGRRYHAYRDGNYFLPNDEAEQDRLDLFHHIFRLALGGKLFCAPINDHPQRVLDFATGTGIWAMDFADEFPSAFVVGTDLSPIQPGYLPPNCSFYIDDVESEWTFNPEEAFDFIHGRAISGAIADLDMLYRRIYNHLKPGGWVEMQDYEPGFFADDDPSLSKAPNCLKMATFGNVASEKVGRIFDIAKLQKQKLIDAGFEDVHDIAYKVPIGTWAKDCRLKELGLYQREHVLLALPSFFPGLFGRILGWQKEEYEVLMAEASQELRNPKLHLYNVFRFVYGRKPMS